MLIRHFRLKFELLSVELQSLKNVCTSASRNRQKKDVTCLHLCGILPVNILVVFWVSSVPLVLCLVDNSENTDVLWMSSNDNQSKNLHTVEMQV